MGDHFNNSHNLSVDNVWILLGEIDLGHYSGDYWGFWDYSGDYWVKRQEAPLPVGVRRSKVALLKLPIKA